LPEPLPREADANDIVNKKKKYIKATFLNGATTHAEETVYLEGWKDVGLRFHIQPCERTIGTSLTWNNWRIRGINRKRGHKRCDGKTIRGWHQHVWKNQCGDKWVESLAERLFGSPPDPQKIIQVSLDRWNIKPIGAIGEQLPINFLQRGGENGTTS